MVIRKFISLFSLSVILLASGGFDHGTSAGKGNLDISLTWNPFNYFKQGQSYTVLGYGITDRIDIHGYYSNPQKGNDNYYGGIFYQFFDSNRLDLSTAVGIRKYVSEPKKLHFFVPQLLYTIKFTGKTKLSDPEPFNLTLKFAVLVSVFLISAITNILFPAKPDNVALIKLVSFL